MALVRRRGVHHHDTKNYWPLSWSKIEFLAKPSWQQKHQATRRSYANNHQSEHQAQIQPTFCDVNYERASHRKLLVIAQNTVPIDQKKKIIEWLWFLQKLKSHMNHKKKRVVCQQTIVWTWKWSGNYKKSSRRHQVLLLSPFHRKITQSQKQHKLSAATSG